MKKLCSLFLVLVFLLSTVTTTFAVSNSELATTGDATLSEIDTELLSNDGSYSYTAPDDGSFLIENVIGAISVSDGIATIEFDDRTVSIPSFAYYKILDPSGSLRFYQADVLKDPDQAGDFVYIGLYLENESDYSIHVNYWDTENKLYNIIISLTQAQFLFFTEDAATITLGSDAVSKRLKDSYRVHTHGSFDNQAVNNSGNSASPAPLALNAIAANSYDTYTNSDGIIHSYVSDYFGEYLLDDGQTITDDPIVRIIPKDLCFILGEHIYVGKEYGFFIRVKMDTIIPSDYAVDVLVFDITHSAPSFTTSETGSSKITPLFQYIYRAANADSLVSSVDPSLTRVVFPHLHYDYAEYFLKDVGFKFSIDNPTALNPGDVGYVASEDNGAFMIQTRLNVSGVGPKKSNNSFAADTAIFTLGFVPYVGTGLSVLSYAHDVYNGFGNGNYFYSRSEQISNNEANINTLKTNSTDQIAAYGNLIKSLSVKLDSDDTKPRLIHVDGGYVEAKYVIARKTGSTYNKLRVVTSISVSIVEDNTSSVLGFESGDVEEYGRGTGTYETGAYRRLGNVSLNGGASASVYANSQTNVIKIVPKVTGSYKISTYSGVGDPNFRITNATTGAAAIAATDDIDGANNRNATLTLNLISGNVYYLEAFRYGTPYAYSIRMGYNPSTTKVLTLGQPYSMSTSNDSYQMLKFTPTTSGYYIFSTNRTSGDPQIFLFSTNGALLDSDDDGGESLNALLEYYLMAGNTYYLAVQGVNGNSTTVVVGVTRK